MTLLFFLVRPAGRLMIPDIVFILDMTPYILYFGLQSLHTCLFPFNPIGLKQTREWIEESFYIIASLFYWEASLGSTASQKPLPAAPPLQNPPSPLSSMT